MRDALFVGRALASARGIVLDPALVAHTAYQGWKAGSRPVAPPTGLARSASDAGVRRTITFTGCGGLYVYLFGVAAYMQQNFAWDPSSTAFASASAGAYPAYLLAAGVDVEAFHQSANRAFIEAVGKHARPVIERHLKHFAHEVVRPLPNERVHRQTRRKLLGQRLDIVQLVFAAFG